MTEEENLILGVLGAGVALVLGFIGMNANKPASTASTGTASTSAPKMKTGCGCGK